MLRSLFIREKETDMIPLLIVTLVVIALSAFITVYTYVRIFYSPKRYDYTVDIKELENGDEKDKLLYSLAVNFAAAPFEEVRISSFDKTELYGRLYYNIKGAPICIQFHGYRSDAMRDFSGGFKTVIDRGHNTLVVDQRAHGKSGDNKITFGVRESLDCKEWVKYVIDRFGEDTEIFLAGVSMGAATVLMALEHDLPGNVKGVFADCGYSSIEKIIKHACKKEGFPPKLVYPFVRLGSILFSRFDPSSKSSAETVAMSDIPVLIFHGDADKVVPCEMAYEIYEGSGKREGVFLEIFPGASHGYSYLTDPERYKKAADDFAKYCLERK